MHPGTSSQRGRRAELGLPRLGHPCDPGPGTPDRERGCPAAQSLGVLAPGARQHTLLVQAPSPAARGCAGTEETRVAPTHPPGQPIQEGLKASLTLEGARSVALWARPAVPPSLSGQGVGSVVGWGLNCPPPDSAPASHTRCVLIRRGRHGPGSQSGRAPVPLWYRHAEDAEGETALRSDSLIPACQARPPCPRLRVRRQGGERCHSNPSSQDSWAACEKPCRIISSFSNYY